MKDIIIIFILLIMLIFESTIRYFIWDRQSSTLNEKIVYFSSIFIPMISLSVLNFSLTLFYVIFFFMCIIQNYIIIISDGNINKSVRMRFIFFASIHLSIIGIIQLFTNYSFYRIIHERYLVYISASIALFIASIIKLSAFVVRAKTNFAIFKNKKEYFQYLYHFMNLNIVYIFFQAILCEKSSNLEPVFALLMMTNLISIMFLCCYILSLSVILSNLDTESSNKALAKSIDKSNESLKKLRKDAYFDNLTGVYSRVFITQKINELFGANIPFSLIYIDLNDLKKVNDSDGHIAGDIYLQNFAKRMNGNARQGDFLARFGGDEFIMVILNCKAQTAKSRIQKISENIGFHFAAGAADTSEANTLEELIKIADKRMYIDKISKKGMKK